MTSHIAEGNKASRDVRTPQSGMGVPRDQVTLEQSRETQREALYSGANPPAPVSAPREGPRAPTCARPFPVGRGSPGHRCWGGRANVALTSGVLANARPRTAQPLGSARATRRLVLSARAPATRDDAATQSIRTKVQVPLGRRAVNESQVLRRSRRSVVSPSARRRLIRGAAPGRSRVQKLLKLQGPEPSAGHGPHA